MKPSLKHLLPLTILVLVTACGGGGGDGDSNQVTPTITSFTVSSATITAGSSVDLTAVFTNGSGSINNGLGSVTSGAPITVTPTTTTTYTLTVTNTVGTEVTSEVTVIIVSLSSLSMTGGTLDQLFQSDQYDYTATVGFLSKSIRIKVTSSDLGATIKVNAIAIGSNNFSQSIDLSEGANSPITITVTSNFVTKTYSLTVTRKPLSTLAQYAYIKGQNPQPSDNFSQSMVSGNTLAVLGTHEENYGAVSIFIRSGTVWNKQAYIKNPEAGGVIIAIALDGNTLALNSNGKVYIYIRNGTTWMQEAIVTGSNPEAGVTFGFSLAIDGDTLVVGAKGESNNAGAVYVFTRSGSVWSQESYIKGTEVVEGDQFGFSVDLSEDTLVIGSPYSDYDNFSALKYDVGSAYVFRRNGSTWSQEQIINFYYQDNNGWEVAVDGDTLVVGSPFSKMRSLGDFGDVFVYTRSGSTWSLESNLIPSNPNNDFEHFGWDVSLDGNTIAVGAPRGDLFTTGVNGAWSSTMNGIGTTYIFTRTGSAWTEKAYIKPSNPDMWDQFGISVDISGGILAVGANGEDSSSPDINGDQNNNDASASGAVYVFE